MSDTSDVIIRPSSADDLDRFRELRLEGLRMHPEAFGSDYDESRAYPEERWLDRLSLGAPERQRLFFAVAGEELVGVTGIRRNDGCKVEHGAIIWGVYVRPAWRGRGVSDRLIDACVDWAAERELRIVKLGVSTTNASAIRCYLRCGFSIYGVEPDVIFTGGKYYDEFLMGRKIGGR